MNRRHFLSCAGGLGLAAALAPAPSQAAVSCVSVHSAKSRCVAGIRTTPPIDPQPCRALTWATCLAYMLRGYGAEMSEETVLSRYDADGTCAASEGASLGNLMRAAGTWRDDFGRRFLVRTERLPDLAAGYLPRSDAQKIIARLSRQPVLCGAAGHATLLTELVLHDSTVLRLNVIEAQVRDPWTDQPNLRQLSSDELKGPSYLIALSVRPL